MMPAGLFASPRHLVPFLLCAVALLASCTSGDSPVAVDRQHTAAPAATAPRTYVYECNNGYSFVARVEGAKVWLFLPAQTLTLPQVPSASGAKFSNGQMTFWSKEAEAVLEAAAGNRFDCRNNPSQAIWEDAKLRGADFRAVGNEPGWHLEIRDGGRSVFVGDYGQTRYEFAASEPIIDQLTGKTTYAMQNAEHALMIVLEATPCRDSMSGDWFETKVLLTLDDKKFSGCGRPLH